MQSEIYEEIKETNLQEEQAYFQRWAEQGPLGPWRKRIKTASHMQIARRRRNRLETSDSSVARWWRSVQAAKQEG